MNRTLKKLSLLLCLMALTTSLLFAQTARTIKGTVLDENGLPIPSATVQVVGGKEKVATDAAGKFTLSTAVANPEISVAFLGYQKQTIKVNESNVVNFKLQPVSNELNQVVVTALGIKREKRALTYAEQSVNGNELRKAASPNFMEALSGKAAGIDISVSNSGAGGSTKAVLRGSKSLTGSSEALYVIDGVPMVNNKGGQPGSYGGNDRGDGLSSLNPADIESISILRGANASILYGSQGANGVIVITTKKGKAGKVSIDINSSTVFDQVATLPEFQFDYGTPGGGDYSWSKTKGNYQSNYIKDFFQTGINATNSLSVSGGSEKTTAYFSYANTTAKGVMPTNTYNKNTITLNQSTKIFDDKLTISSNVIFASEKSKNRPGAGYYNNPLTGLYLFARERDFADYKTNYQIFDANRNLYKMNWYSTEEKQNNPYWELYNDPKLATSNRVIANVKLAYNIAPHLKFETRGNIDYNDVLFDNRYAAGGNSVSVSPNGTWSYTKYNDKALYADGILTYDNNFGKFSLNGLLGGSYQDNTFNNGMNVTNGTVSLMYPNFFSFSNMPYNVIFNQTLSRVVKNGLFANAQLGYKEMIYLDLSARNDWASTLAGTGNGSYLYPAAGISLVVSQMITMPKAISFLKIRGSISQTGNEVPYNVVNPGNSIGSAGGPTGIGGITRNTQVPFQNLKPEKIQSDELGLEMKFLNNRISLDFTYYQNTSTNQFLTLTAPSGSGYSTYYVNAGKIVNKGLELTLSANAIKTADFSWTSALNLSRNKNKIVELIVSNPDYQVGGDDEGFASIIKAGGSFNDLYIYKFNRNDAGQIILDANGVPTKAAKQTLAGNLNPNLIAGWNNSFNYKSFFLSALVNAKFGGIAFSKTEAFLDSYGVSKRSGDARASGTIPINAIQGTTPITQIDPVVYYSAIGDRNKIMEPYVYSRTNIRLAQLALGYTFKINNPKLKINELTFSLVGRNLFFFYKKTPFDPEQSMSTSNSQQSNDVFGVPAIRSYGFNLKLNF